MQPTLKLHEIETGAADVSDSGAFLSALLQQSPKVATDGLQVFSSGIQGLDINVSRHLPAGKTRISLLTNDLRGITDRLLAMNLPFEGPYESHLGMLSIRFEGKDGLEWVINTPTDQSPEWLQA